MRHYDPIAEAFRKARPQGKELVRWKYQHYMKDYLSTVAGVDRNIGRVLDYLKETGLDKNTIVVYSADQGSTWVSTDGSTNAGCTRKVCTPL